MKTKNALKKVATLALTFIMVFGATSAAGLAWLPGLFGSFGISAQAASESNLTFVLINDGTAYEVSKCNDSAEGALTVPSTYNGKPVTSIGFDAFSDCFRLSVVTIPDSVTSIGDCAFSYCTGLGSITIPGSVTSIGEKAFWFCISLIDITVNIANEDYSSIDGVLYSKDKSFLIQYPLGNTRASYSMPDSVTSIGYCAFLECKKLTNILVSSANAKFSSQDGVLFNKDKTLLIQYPIGNARTSYSIPDNVMSICKQAFWSCTSLNSVTIPDSVTSIDEWAFFNCTGLSSVTIPDSVTSIGKSAFYGCTGLTSVKLGSCLRSIGDSAFSDCPNISDVYYNGSESDRANIVIGFGNEDLIDENWYYTIVASFFSRLIAFIKYLFNLIFMFF